MNSLPILRSLRSLFDIDTNEGPGYSHLASGLHINSTYFLP